MATLNWVYCECGCKGHEFSVSGQNYWMFNDLKGTFYLHRGHGRTGSLLGTFTSFEDADEAAAKLVHEALTVLQKAVSNVKESRPVSTPNRFHRPDPISIDFFEIVPETTKCKHGQQDCSRCGTSNRRDAIHATKRGVGAVGKLQRKR